MSLHGPLFALIYFSAQIINNLNAIGMSQAPTNTLLNKELLFCKASGDQKERKIILDACTSNVKIEG